MKSPFIRPSSALYQGKEHYLTAIYSNNNFLINEIFFRRLERLTRLIPYFTPPLHADVRPPRRALDLGCGVGVMLPTLSVLFEEVYALDLTVDTARRTVQSAGLSNVRLAECDMNAFEEDVTFDVIVSTDVFEHMRDLSIPLRFVDRYLAPGGSLVISLPTENAFYHLGRKVFGVTPPPDHYHKSRDVLNYFRGQGYDTIRHYRYPFRLPHFLTVFDLATLQKRRG
jgi:2-polyprenyl-3-methyl-5-hydroxy-6-metoxy-1,4-benzoquinol methylase